MPVELLVLAIVVLFTVVVVVRRRSGTARLVANRYRLEQPLARGGMGAVYRARDLQLDRVVAIKIVRSGLVADPAAAERFRRGAQSIARLHHPSIVAVYDYGTPDDEGAYLVMELVRGEDLRRVLQREGRLEVDRAIRILSGVCAGVEAAHRQGVLHHDLKPENILLPEGGLAPKVLDFSIAHVFADETPGGAMLASAAAGGTAAATIVGTPAYMAPEQFHASAADTRTDVFSLGVIAYEMLTGDLPFGRGSLSEIAMAHSRGARAMPPDVVPAALDRAVRAALEVQPDRRPSSAQAFAHLLAAAAEV